MCNFTRKNIAFFKLAPSKYPKHQGSPDSKQYQTNEKNEICNFRSFCEIHIHKLKTMKVGPRPSSIFVALTERDFQLAVTVSPSRRHTKTVPAGAHIVKVV
jgi:hypothetical protein